MNKSSIPPVYILHGWAVDPKNEEKWQKIRDALGKNGVESKFIGLPGLTIPLDEVWGLDNYVAWLKNELPLHPVTVAGHSFGGQLAVRFASLHPERVEKLILIDSSGIRDHSLFGRLKRIIFFSAAKIGKIFSFLPFMRVLLYKLARERDYLEAPALLRRTMSQVVAQEIRDDLRNIGAKTLIIWGENDKITPVKNLEFFKQIHDSTAVIIANARHSPQFTHPEEVASSIARFLTE